MARLVKIALFIFTPIPINRTSVELFHSVMVFFSHARYSNVLAKENDIVYVTREGGKAI